jgi:hypothetical protein
MTISIHCSLVFICLGLAALVFSKNGNGKVHEIGKILLLAGVIAVAIQNGF